MTQELRVHPNSRKEQLVSCQNFGFSFSFESEGSKLIIAGFNDWGHVLSVRLPAPRRWHVKAGAPE
jgi:hypothetical protein